MAFEGAKGSLEQEISDKVQFDFSIDYNPSDGWIMIAFDSHSASLEPLLTIIKEKGVLTDDDYFTYSI